mgnify:CR=1 FL=1|tara:strand:- start:971 stop:2545 length:1575 start_codon:yes stop_codon:yes gene_type:complete
MILKKKDTNNYLKVFSLIIICFYSFFINFYYSNFGVFPIDTFLHYDSGYRILKNEFPIRDYWIVSGFIVDFIQAFFFKIFGINWVSYKIHSSLFNLVVSISAFYFFLNLNLGNLKSLIYSISFATLAYTISGTPFVDQHASFFLLLSTFAIIIAFKKGKEKYFWPISILLFFFSFLSKQVPALYTLILQGPIIIYYLYSKKKLQNLKIIFLSVLIIFVSFLIILILLDISFRLFLTEFIIYPTEIGSDRLNLFNLSFESFFNKYKFILIPITICIIIGLLNRFKKDYFSFTFDTLKFLLILSLSVGLLTHQLMTKNQIFIYFLIPILFSFLDKNLNNVFKKRKKLISLVLLSLIILITTKYHLRFNENRKFHELEHMNFEESVNAEIIDNSLKGNLWINPSHTGSALEEVLKIKESIKEIEKEKEEIMLITNYSFIDSITKKNMNMPNKAFTMDGTTHPRSNNKRSKYYKKFINNLIKKNNIKKIFFLKHEQLPSMIITEYINKGCYDYEENQLFYIFKVKCSK